MFDWKSFLFAFRYKKFSCFFVFLQFIVIDFADTSSLSIVQDFVSILYNFGFTPDGVKCIKMFFTYFCPVFKSCDSQFPDFEVFFRHMLQYVSFHEQFIPFFHRL